VTFSRFVQRQEEATHRVRFVAYFAEYQCLFRFWCTIKARQREACTGVTCSEFNSYNNNTYFNIQFILHPFSLDNIVISQLSQLDVTLLALFDGHAYSYSSSISHRLISISFSNLCTSLLLTMSHLLWLSSSSFSRPFLLIICSPSIFENVCSKMHRRKMRKICL